jgi:hypothetical protein
MALQQGNACALCGQGKPEHVDHDHVSGRVRGILCFGCNRALGYVADEDTHRGDILLFTGLDGVDQARATSSSINSHREFFPERYRLTSIPGHLRPAASTNEQVVAELPKM